jgi:hypothetical protein
MAAGENGHAGVLVRNLAVVAWGDEQEDVTLPGKLVFVINFVYIG